MVKKIILAFVFLLLVASASAQEVGFLGSFPQNECIDLPQTCSNCTYNNITSIITTGPNATKLLGEVAMDMDGTEYNYTFCDTDILGIYTVNGKGDLDGETEIWIYDFEVTPTGNLFNSSQGMLYFLLMLVVIGLFGFSLWGAMTLEWKNKRNHYDEIIEVNWKKYLKIFSWIMSYVFLVWIVYLAWNLTFAYLQMRGLGLFFRYVFTMLVGFALPVFSAIVILSLVSFFRDKNIQKMLNMGQAAV